MYLETEEAEKCKHEQMNIAVLWKGRKQEQNKDAGWLGWGSVAEFLLSIRKVLRSNANMENKTKQKCSEYNGQW